jgi:hypothetical protein
MASLLMLRVKRVSAWSGIADSFEQNDWFC